MKRVLLIITAATAVFFTSCKKEDNKNPSPQNPEKPFAYMKAGNRWVFDFVYNNNVVDSLIILVKSENNGLFEVSTSDKVQVLNTFRYIENNNLYEYNAGQTKANAILLMKTNPQKGDAWTYFNGSDSVVNTVTETNMAVTVPAGTFTCTKFESKYKNSGINSVYYVNDKSSLIKIEIPAQGAPQYVLRSKNF